MPHHLSISHLKDDVLAILLSDPWRGLWYSRMFELLLPLKLTLLLIKLMLLLMLFLRTTWHYIRISFAIEAIWSLPILSYPGGF